MRVAFLAFLSLVSALAALAPADAVERVGERHDVSPNNMPAPYSSPAVANSAERVRRAAAQVPAVPPGFKANAFATGLSHARWLAVAPNGDVFLAEPGPGKITLLRDEKGNGRADLMTTFASGFEYPHGMAFHGGYLYVADVRGVWRVPYRDGQTKTVDAPEQVTAEGAIGDSSGHWTRNIAFAPDGTHFYVAIGSASNIGEEAAPRATVQEFDASGHNQRTFASGLRNPVGIAFYPGSNDLFVVVNERDGLGDELPGDYLTHLERGAFYGWPYAYLGPHPQPGYGDKRPDLVRTTVVPDQLFRAHSAPLGLAFYRGTAFPAHFRGGAFVALHGSWNAATPRGYMVAYVPFENGRPKGGYESFATGFWVAGTSRAEVWGRPVGLAEGKDGSLLVADDVSQSVWRISYQK